MRSSVATGSRVSMQVLTVEKLRPVPGSAIKLEGNVVLPFSWTVGPVQVVVDTTRKEVWVGDRSDRAVHVAEAGWLYCKRLSLDGYLGNNPSYYGGLLVVGGLSVVEGGGGVVELHAYAASSNNPVRHSPPINFVSKFWDGTTSVARGIWLFGRMVAADDYHLVVHNPQTGTDLLDIDKNGLIRLFNHLQIPADKSILGRVYAGTAQTVTETSATLKDSVGPVAPKNVLYPLTITVDANNPTGSLVTLYVELRLYHSDGTETVVDSFSVAEGSATSKSYTSDAIAKAFKDGASVVEVRLYAWCSATPASGYEPTVTLTEVKGIQF